MCSGTRDWIIDKREINWGYSIGFELESIGSLMSP
jgi:hypothetical protein